MAVWDDGTGSALYVGAFDACAGTGTRGLAKWDGHTWSEVGCGLGMGNKPEDVDIWSMVVFRGALYISGRIDRAGNLPLRGIARWDGNEWSDVGGGFGDPSYGFPQGHGLAVYDDGHGEQLYATGRFGSAGGVPANSVARWNGGEWSPAGDAFAYGTTLVFMGAADFGTGSFLYMGGLFKHVNGEYAGGLARWDGKEWHAVGAGLKHDDSAFANCFAVFDDGKGPALYVGGHFKAAGGQPGTRSIARWDGTNWSTVGGGVDNIMGEGSQDVRSLVVFDDGGGPDLYAGGGFVKIGGVEARGIARWDGSAWAGLDSLMQPHYVDSMQEFGSDAAPTLWVSGSFSTIDGQPARGMARFSCLPSPCPGDCDGNGQFDVADFVCFTAQFDARDPAADLDHSTGYGQFDLFDFLCFLNAFNEGCP